MPSRRIVNTAGLLACLGLLGFGYYLQFVEQLEPCPLCVFQRVAYIAVALLFAIAAAHHPSRIGARVYGALIGVAALAGAAIAGWHIRLQNLPPGEAPACGPGLEYMLDAFPLAETIKMAFTGSGECADVSWMFLGLTIPAWALVWFVLLAVAGVAGNFRAGGRG